MNKLVSVIISVYNKELFLKECIESLINMNIDKSQIEAIFVDDCSTDKSVEMIEQYAKDYEFIKLVKLPTNTGSPSTPRNVGIEEAQGKYITLLDADDWLDVEGFPQFIQKVNDDDADFGLGQSFKHTGKNIAYHARFTAYKDESHLKPEDIEKIFRAVGPPGKVFKRDLVLDNHIQFEHMKYGEDKLFFTELISKVNDITMTTLPVYHVNRFDENVSLVKQTSVIDKGYINLEVAKRICEMDTPSTLKKMALSRVVEVDFISRLLRTKTFLKSLNREEFYTLFDKLEQLLNEHGYQVIDLLKNEVFIAIYKLYQREDKQQLVNFINDVINKNWSYVIQNDVIYMDYFNKYDVIDLIPVRCYPIYEGTQLIEGEKYEVVKVMKPQDLNIRTVKLQEINNASNTRKLEFKYENGRIYIHHSQFEQLKAVDINLSVEAGETEHSLVYASYPSNNDIYKMKRQSFKVEFIYKDKEKTETAPVNPEDKYFLKISGPLMTLKKVKLYKDLEFREPITNLVPGTKVEPTEVQYSLNGTPRIVLKDGNIVTANKDFVAPIDTKKPENYITEVPEQVKILKKCKLYDSRNFKDNSLKTLEVGDTFNIQTIIYTSSSTPRLVTEDGFYLTANKDFVEVVK
ncbi:glycosyltransferase [Staphylococcus caledonicus]|uniref:glycosyltransferase n=1 Tax=Staphylococcus caledonicus TaxID=2741333 RepID=UPI0018E4C950|nr:glycosyltransferase [Staphylococcus caledonicus]MBI5973642.1 glycosyltransferase [Staphylococcus caledonicus]